MILAEHGRDEEKLNLTRTASVWVVREKEWGQFEILLAKRKLPPEEGRYSPPGGKINSGEKAVQAAVRELEEETGTKVDPGDLKLFFQGPQHFDFSDRHYQHFAHLLEWREEFGEPINNAPKEHEDWKWIDLRALESACQGFNENLSLALSVEIYVRQFLAHQEAVMGDYPTITEERVERLILEGSEENDFIKFWLQGGEVFFLKGADSII